MDINKTLAERGKTYGSFTSHARISQNIIRAMSDSPNWTRLADDQREALHIIANKLGRILNGNPDFHDSWHDIVGYAKLVADRLLGTPEPTLEDQIAVVWPLPVEEVVDE